MTKKNGLQPTLAKLVQGESLTEDEMAHAMGLVMDGAASDAQVAGFLTALRIRGETLDEIVGAVRAMRARAHTLEIGSETILDTCGTGGDGASTFNISTACAFVCAAAGVTVAKHGNRAISSRVGSADVLETLGLRIDLQPKEVARAVDTLGIGFMFAPTHHSALRHAAPARKQLGFRTMLNLLGPMTNPAHATHQLIGVFARDRLVTMAQVLGRLGTKRALVVHGSDGLDEITLAGPTYAALLQDGHVSEIIIDPKDVELTYHHASELAGGDAEHNARIIRSVLRGEPGPPLDVVRLNAGAALWIAQCAPSLAEGVALASQTIRSGKAIAKLDALIKYTQGAA